MRGDLRASDRGTTRRGTPAFPRRRALRCRSRPADGHRRPCRGRGRSRSRRVRCSHRASTRAYGKSTAATGSRATCPKSRARGRGRKHGLPDRQGAFGHAQGHPLRRFEAEAVAAAHSRPRSLLVADDDAPSLHHRRIAARGKLQHRDTLIGSSPRELSAATASNSSRARLIRQPARCTSRMKRTEVDGVV